MPRSVVDRNECRGHHCRGHRSSGSGGRYNMASAPSAPTRQLVSTAFVFRHGARGITSSAERKLLCHGGHLPLHACHEWLAEEHEHITDVGLQQMRILGGWFYRYLARNGKLELHKKWRSSLVTRVVESGGQFWKGFCAAAPTHIHVPTVPHAYAADAEADIIFRSWFVKPDYVSLLATLEGSVDMQRAALKVVGELAHMYRLLSGEASAPGDSKTLPWGDAELARRLYQITYLKELYDCEVSWPGTSLAIRNGARRDALDARTPAGADTERTTATGSTPPYLVASVGMTSGKTYPVLAGSLPFEYPTGVDVTVVPSVKNRLLSRMSACDEAFLHHAAWWVWDQRFFSHPSTKSKGGDIGGALLTEVFHDFAKPSGSASVYSAHDYTILACLAALKCRKGPDTCLGFGSFLLLECFAEARGNGLPPLKTVKASLCALPFPDTRAGYPLNFSSDGCQTLFDGVSLEGLLALSTKWQTSAVHTPAVTASSSVAAAETPGGGARASGLHSSEASRPGFGYGTLP